jgi:hypothetical protein
MHIKTIASGSRSSSLIPCMGERLAAHGDHRESIGCNHCNTDAISINGAVKNHYNNPNIVKYELNGANR